MEVKGGSNKKFQVLLYEMLGTANLLYAINVSAHGGHQPYAVGLTIAANIFIFGEVSGGHFNPAVTIMMYANNSITLKDTFFYIISQLLGALAILTIFFKKSASQIVISFS